MTESVHDYMNRLGRAAREASRVVARATTAQKNQALLAAAAALDAARDELAEANRLDLQQGRDNGLDAAMLDRLALTDKVVDGMIEGLRQVAALPDPIGEISLRYLANSVPTHYFIDAEGNVASILKGAVSAEEIAAQLDLVGAGAGAEG